MYQFYIKIDKINKIIFKLIFLYELDFVFVLRSKYFNINY